MGREVNRVPLDFKWPLKKVWEGFLMPDELGSTTCPECGGEGYNPETRKLAADWYDLNGFGSRWWYDYKTGIDGQPTDRAPWKVFGTTRRWSTDLTQDEVDALLERGRLHEYTHMWVQGTGWTPDPSKEHPTAERINHDMQFGFGHDAINRYICVEVRAKRLGIYGLCPHCNGEGVLWRDEAHKAAHEAWEPAKLPQGEGWQMWETTSEGSPISPVMETPEKLAAWLVRNNASSFGDSGASFTSWLAMIRQGWAPSAIGSSKGFQSGVDAALDLTRPVFNVYETAVLAEEEPKEADDDRSRAMRRFQRLREGNRHRDRSQFEYEDDFEVVFPPKKPEIAYAFEAIFPEADESAPAVIEFLDWLTERGIERKRPRRYGNDLIVVGKLGPDVAFEFKTRWS